MIIMKISPTTNLNFKAKFISTAQIKKFDKEAKQFLPHRISFVELEPENSVDVAAVDDIFNSWGKVDMLSKIKTSFETMHFYPEELSNSKFYGVTVQASDFNEFNSESIMGIAEISPMPHKEIYLDFLQVKPDLKADVLERQYKNIGTAILNSLKEIFDTIRLYSLKNSVEFYEINGFIPMAKGNFLEHVWEKVLPGDSKYNL